MITGYDAVIHMVGPGGAKTLVFGKPPRTEAERLLEDAVELLAGRCLGDVIYPNHPGAATAAHLARVALALKFRSAPAGLRFRAVLEAWSLARIIHELY